MGQSAKTEGWYAVFDQLPEERKARMREWFKTQEVIIASLEMSADAWFEYVAWAMEHPHERDYLDAIDAAAHVQEKVSDTLGSGAKSEQLARKSVGDAAALRPVAKGRPVGERSQGNDLDRALLSQLLSGRRKG